MSINNRQLLAASGSAAALAGVIGTAGLSFDGRFDPRDLAYTAPFAIGAVIGSLRAPRTSAAMLFGVSAGVFAIEAWSAYVNRQGCTILLDFASSGDFVPPACSPVGLASLVIASIASVTAATLLVVISRTTRGVAFALAGIVLAPVLLYLLSIATFALRGA